MLNQDTRLAFGRALDMFRRIERIMADEGENNWINGIRRAIATLECADNTDIARRDALKSVAQMYRIMMGAKDGFGDYLIWRDDLQTRVGANRELDALRTELWNVLTERADI
jgi:hypothetical protein